MEPADTGGRQNRHYRTIRPIYANRRRTAETAQIALLPNLGVGTESGYERGCPSREIGRA